MHLFAALFTIIPVKMLLFTCTMRVGEEAFALFTGEEKKQQEKKNH